MKLNEKRRLDRIVSGLLVILGFGAAMAGCDDGAFRGEPAMYGVPHAEFELKGAVTDEEGVPIEGIEISARWADDKFSEATPVVTDAEGRYILDDPYWWPFVGDIVVMARDIDGAAGGGEFASETETIKVTDADYTGGSGDWYEGKLSKTADFTLSQETK